MREEVQTCRNQIAQLNALIAKMEAFDDPGEVFDTLMGLRDNVRVENAKLMGLNELVTQAEEEIEMKEAQLECLFVVKVNDKYEACMEILLVDYCVLHVHFEELDAYVTAGSLAKLVLCNCDIENGHRLKALNCSYLYVSCGAEYCIIPAHLVSQPYLVYMGPFFILDKLSEVAESPRLVDKMKYVFGRSRGEDESFAGLMRDLCLSLRISLSKKRRLVAELEAVGEVEGVVKCLEHMRVIVARDAVTLEELETLLRRAQVGVSLKDGFVADMEVKD
ncbi:hypothetical protein Tco_0625172 [Tanacetum coccineum]|uniref:Uncharacterized protein n=1 Tax=Tanacetum coccineum TaxID=301880 RepID=A0ABQ4WG13_9ASTR